LRKGLYSRFSTKFTKCHDLDPQIRVDVLALDRRALRQNVTWLGQYNVKLLAEKVETRDDWACSQALGCDYFQGYFLCEPDIVTG
jgi:EAL and modified HD-GYP domain-containing signal transduction protein